MEAINLTTTQGRIQALGNLNKECHERFIEIGIELSPDALFDVKQSSLEISIRETDVESDYFGYSAFASEITLYPNNRDYFRNKEVTINFGSSGEFTPNNQSSYWRTIHAASVLKNWDKVCELVNEYCNKSKQLSKQIFEANN